MYPPLNDRLLSYFCRLHLLDKHTNRRNRVVDAAQAASETDRHFKELQELLWALYDRLTGLHKVFPTTVSENRPHRSTGVNRTILF